MPDVSRVTPYFPSRAELGRILSLRSLFADSALGCFLVPTREGVVLLDRGSPSLLICSAGFRPLLGCSLNPLQLLRLLQPEHLHVHRAFFFGSRISTMPPTTSRPQPVPAFSGQARWRFCAREARVVPTEVAATVNLPASGAFRTAAREEPAGSPSIEARRIKEGRAFTVPFLILPGLQC